MTTDISTDTGYVKDILEHAYDLECRYCVMEQSNRKKKQSLLPAGQVLAGRCSLHYDNNYITHVHIYYTQQFINSYNIFLRAHEETHALYYMNALDALKIELQINNFNMAAFELLAPEVIANIGGIYALRKQGYCNISEWYIGWTLPIDGYQDYKKANDFLCNVEKYPII